MLRLKLFLGAVGVTAVVAGGAQLMVGGLEDSAVRARRAEIHQGGAAARAAISLVEGTLRDSADEIRRGVLPAYLATIKEVRSQIEALEPELYKDNPDPHDEAQKTAREDLVRDRTELVDAFVNGLERNIETVAGAVYWKTHDKGKILKAARKAFIECAAFAVNNCLFRFTYEPLSEFVASTEGQARRTTQQLDLVIVVDDKGTGRADSSDEKWSDHEGYARSQALLQAALTEGRSDVDVFYRANGQRTLLARGVPLKVGDTTVGAALIGVELAAAFVREVKEVARLEVLVLHGDRVVASTENDQDLVMGIKADASGHAQGDHGPWSFAVEPVVEGSDEPVRVVVAANAAAAGNMLGEACLIVAGLCVVFLILMLLFGEITSRAIRSGFEKIDQGIHEIIAGNKDFEFPFKQGEKGPANSMAQSLNLMLALLLGRPLPEEIDREQLVHWTDHLYSSRDPAKFGAGDHADDDDDEDEEDDDYEAPPERTAAQLAAEDEQAYYQRVFNEYRDAKAAVGDDVSDLTLDAFVNKVSRIEAQMVSEHDASKVRFNVTVQGGKATLSPVFLD